MLILIFRLAEKRKKMNKEEIKLSIAEEAFDFFDLDGSKDIDKNEFIKVMKELCCPLEDKQVHYIHIHIYIFVFIFTFTFLYLHFCIYTFLYLHFCIYTFLYLYLHLKLHFTFYILHITFYILHFTFYILYFIFYILHFIFYILHFTFTFKFLYLYLQVDDAIASMDKDGSGVVEFSEFVGWYNSDDNEKASSVGAQLMKVKLIAAKKVRDLSGLTIKYEATNVIVRRERQKIAEIVRMQFRRKEPADHWYHEFGILQTQQ